MSMLKKIVCGTLIGVAASVVIGAGAADAGQPWPPVPPPAWIPVAPVAPMILPPMPAIAPMPPMVPTAPIPAIAPMAISPFAYAFDSGDSQDREDQLYERARDAIENARYERALDALDAVIAMNAARVDAALYWKAYSLAKIGRRDDALTTVADMARRFKDSRWIKDARALEVEVRQGTGQPVSPDAQSDEELKMYALNGLMQSDPERALPAIEKILTGASSIKLKEKALFVLGQSRSTRAREILASIAKGGANPDLQLRAIRYIGVMGGTESRQILDDAYRSAADAAVKRAILRSFMTSGDRARLLALAKGEKDAALRGEAVQQLGVMGAHAEIAELYQTETAPEVKKRILHAMFVGGNADKLSDLAKTEKDVELRKEAIRDLGLMGGSRTGDTLRAIYTSDSSPEIRKAVIQGLFVQNNARTLVDLARAEKNIEMKKEIVQKLSIMKSPEAKDYLLELLK